jgi:GTP cyclohydrolase I
MYYERLFHTLMAKQLSSSSKGQTDEKILDSELKKIKSRMLELNAARKKMVKGYEMVLEGLKMGYESVDLEDPNMIGTPDRMARALLEVCSGLGLKSDSEIFSSSFPSGRYDEVVMVKDIEFTSLCSHHFFPFVGMAHIGYLPAITESKGKSTSRVTGLSKLARVVDVYASRPQLQERMCVQIMEAIKKEIDPRGIMVVLVGKHGCMGCRGVKKPKAMMITSALDGTFQSSSKLRAEFLSLLSLKGND